MSYKTFLRHPFLIDNFWFGLSSIFLNVLNYAYVLLALHYLSKEEFGAFNALVGMLTLATIAANPLQLQVTKTVALTDGPLLRKHLAGVLAGTLKLVLVALLAVALASTQLGSLLNVPADAVILVGVVSAVSVLATLAVGISSGLRALSFQAALGIAASITKFLCAFSLFEVGFKLGAGLAGYFAGFALTVAVTWYMLRNWERPRKILEQRESSGDSVVVLVFSYLFIAAPFNLDQILVQILNSEISGDYAALVTLGKLAFFASIPFQLVLYSYLANSRNAQQQLRFLWAGLALTLGSALVLTVILWFGGRALVGLLLAPGYANVADWVGVYSLGVCGYVFANAVVSLAIVRGDARILVPTVAATITQIALFHFRHETLEQIVINQLLSFALLSLATLLYLLTCSSIKRD